MIILRKVRRKGDISFLQKKGNLYYLMEESQP